MAAFQHKILFPLFVCGMTLVILASAYEGDSGAIPIDGPFPEHYTHPTPNLPRESLPTEFSWTNVNGTDYTTPVLNQFDPQWCGSCWAMAAASALSDRIKIAKKAQFPEVILSPQVLISCDHYSRGCYGGSSHLSYKWIHENGGLTDSTCAPYQARGWTNGIECSKSTECWTCDFEGYCSTPKSYQKWTIEEYGSVKGEVPMMNEIVARGPISCLMDSHLQSFHNYTEGIIAVDLPKLSGTHFVTLVGFGEDNGTPYWLGKNSFGDSWGFNGGYFKIFRGNNTLGIEEEGCAWAVPNSDPVTITNTDFPAQGLSMNADVIVEPMTAADPPATLDWRDRSGENWISATTLNQNSPNVCDSSYLVASVQMLTSRFNILQKNQWPRTTLNAQALLDCRAGGEACGTGTASKVFDFLKTNGVTGAGCRVWIAAPSEKSKCEGIDMCKQCEGKIPHAPRIGEDGQQICWAVESERYYVADHGIIKGADAMKKEIEARGPITCILKLTEGFKNYSGGIYSEVTPTPLKDLGHHVEVIGWGASASGQDYWIARNTMGTFWGEYGFFRIAMNENNLGITEECAWATPSLTKVEEDIQNFISQPKAPRLEDQEEFLLEAW
mmetsp:Transcript_50845/g.58319  ORF Transcript_50845/g.58319 Transcript_50845/m.58319 type:complete len:611 (+) Transcript_50845:37-1869(+)